jgi:hypothetical protein
MNNTTPESPKATDELMLRIDEATSRITSGMAPMRIPADRNDADIVLADCETRIRELSAQLLSAQRATEEARKSEMKWKRDAWDTIVAMARACGLPEAQDPMVAPDDYVLPPEWEGKMSDTMRKIVAEHDKALADLAQARSLLDDAFLVVVNYAAQHPPYVSQIYGAQDPMGATGLKARISTFLATLPPPTAQNGGAV